MKNNYKIKSIVCLTMVVALTGTSFGNVVYSPGITSLYDGPGIGLENNLPSASTMNDQVHLRGYEIGQAPGQASEGEAKIVQSPSSNDSISSYIKSTNESNNTETTNTNATSNTTTELNKNSFANTFVDVDISSAAPTLQAPAYILVNTTNGHIYAKKDENTKFEPAGLANLMTAYLATNIYSLESLLSVTDTAVKGVDKDASIAALNVGDNITLKDAIASMFVKGCVDSANVVAENVSGSIEDFVKLMNNSSQSSLNLANTTFTNPSGINDEKQLTTAYDIALLMGAVCSKPELVDLLKLSTYILPPAKRRDKLTLYSKNSHLLNTSSAYNPDVTCSRLGYNSKARYCIASMMNYQNCNIVAVILKANGSQFSDTKKLFDYAKIACYEDLYGK